ncbi:MAG: DUF2059 domain-containing protein [Bauldia sp.]
MRGFRALVGAVALTIAGWSAGPASAQEIADTHLQAALEAIQALGTDDDFDEVLPGVANQVETILIQQRPDLYQQIHTVVYDMAGQLAARRADLNNDVARVWALAFTEEELRAITAFYTSPAGMKLSQLGQPVMTDTVDTLQAWSERLGTELLDRALAEFQRQNIQF